MMLLVGLVTMIMIKMVSVTLDDYNADNNDSCSMTLMLMISVMPVITSKTASQTGTCINVNDASNDNHNDDETNLQAPSLKNRADLASR